jgi:hypothetical protein
MTTKAELQAELDLLRAKMAEFDEMKEAVKADRKEETETEPADRARAAISDAASELERILAPYGVSVSEIEALAERFWNELDTIPRQKPLLTAIGIFALGFLLGRMTR